MFHRIAPTGNPIRWRTEAPPPLLTESVDRCLYYQSGTAALAAAIQCAKQAHGADTPEVILPGYACPDLVSAAIFAGTKPVLVDLDEDRPYLSLQQLELAITENTVAVVAVNFLGIPERIADIRAVTGDRSITIIEDSAQWFPTDESKVVSECYDGDLVVLSFSKGKPIGLMGGGALLVRESTLTPPTPPLVNPVTTVDQVSARLKFFAYNCAISPACYWLLEQLPMLNLGATVYKTLEQIRGMDKTKTALLTPNIDRYQHRGEDNQHTIHAMLERHGLQSIDLPQRCESYCGQRLLRYPVLLETPAQRDDLMAAFTDSGLGASQLYNNALPQIEGLPDGYRCPAPLTNASSFAARLLTLPTHELVSGYHHRLIEHHLTETLCQ